MTAATYSHKTYMALKDLRTQTAHETFISLSGPSFIQDVARPLLQRHKCQQLWGFALLYRPFDLSSTERLTRYADAAIACDTDPYRADEGPDPFSRMMRRKLLITEATNVRGSLYMAYEFEARQEPSQPRETSSEEPSSVDVLNFLDAFARETRRAGLDGVLGLSHWPWCDASRDAKGLLERIEDEAVVYYDHGEYGFAELVDAVQSGWFWWEQDSGAREVKVWAVDRRVKQTRPRVW
ncbi:hypothetical protein LTS15_001476 [Exophiala xenobiotica]|nr:hypothetical protein LTS15_001476 [Exophiala xenobiotica]